MGRERGLANEIRAGLDPDTGFAPANGEGRSPLDELFFGKPVGVHVREFGSLFALICLIIAGFRGYRHDSLSAILIFSSLAAVFAGLGYFFPAALRPVWKGWMAFAHVLSIVMTFVLLSLVWIVGFIPMSVIVKIFKVKLMETGFRTGHPSYWEVRDPKYDDFKRLEQQY
jgi:hypothetical protein